MVQNTHIRCGRLYTGVGSEILDNVTVVVKNNVIDAVLPSGNVPADANATILDYSKNFVIPGMIDVHTHMAYGNAKTEEDIDLYSSMEFRAIRSAYFAHHVLASGFTSIYAPGDAGMIARATRDAVDAGLFPGPRISAAGPYITSRQGLTDWYPTWIGVPTTSIGKLVTNRDDAIEEIRKQVKEGVDGIKIAMDGIQRRPNGELIAAFNLDETKAMVDEIHRLGRVAIAHARGREATLYSAKCGIDLIFHASEIDDEGLEAAVKNNCTISPTLTMLRNTMDFVEPEDPAYRERRISAYQREFEAAAKNLQRVKKAGIPMPIGTDSGFAVTPYGEWHARELEIYVDYLGFTPIEALEAATSISGKLLRPVEKVGVIAKGYQADLVALAGDPTQNISILLDRSKFAAVVKGGQETPAAMRDYDPKRVSDFTQIMSSDLYTRERVAELGLLKSNHQAQ